jgi:hypothetical protein
MSVCQAKFTIVVFFQRTHRAEVADALEVSVHDRLSFLLNSTLTNDFAFTTFSEGP